MNLDFFAEENGSYSRFNEEIIERVYTKEQVEKALKSANLETLAVFEEMTMKKPGKRTQRLVYVTRRI